MVQILAKLTLAHQFVQIAMRGHDHTHVDGNRPVTTDPLHFLLLQNAQQFGLHQRRHVADLIQEQRAAVRLLELPGVPRGRSRERAFLMSE